MKSEQVLELLSKNGFRIAVRGFVKFLENGLTIVLGALVKVLEKIFVLTTTTFQKWPETKMAFS